MISYWTKVYWKVSVIARKNLTHRWKANESRDICERRGNGDLSSGSEANALPIGFQISFLVDLFILLRELVIIIKTSSRITATNLIVIRLFIFKNAN